MNYNNEFGYAGHMLPILINYKVIHHTLTYCGIILSEGASLLTGGMLECNIAHRRSLAVLCMQYMFRNNPRHIMYGAGPVPRVPMPDACGVLFPHMCT